ncbi:MAG: ATP-binding cassette domain-containing protein, partial [Firmicutes bacterium]|nr:ATP-binding cassette domain-containing protein [Bacillota bacterium]
TPQETRALFDILRSMREAGCAIVLITHKMNEVMEVSDRVTVMRKGETIATVNTSEVSALKLTEMMVGREIKLEIKRDVPERSEHPMLTVSGLETKEPGGRKVLEDFSFELYGGEILGVAGIAGSGQKELCELIAGLMKATGGSVKFMDEEILGKNPREILLKGVSMSFVPEDRLGMGLVAGMDIIDNIILKTYSRTKGFMLDRNSGRTLAENLVENFDINTPSVYHIVKKLSGGNIQKVLLAREVYANPKLLITAYPVRGLDIGASYNVYDILNEQKKKGVAVLFIGEDLDVLMALCDRLLVMHDGKVMDIVDPGKTSKEKVGFLMMGHKSGMEEAS